MPEISCRHFSGYKPCGLNESCDKDCPSRSVPEHRLLLVHLGAMGAVLRSTCLLPAIHRKYPNAHLTWVTEKISAPLLAGHPMIDKVLAAEPKELLALAGRQFDAVFVVDKSSIATGIARSVQAKRIYGFTSDAVSGAILPATAAAEELWNLGLSNHLKFHVNRKPETRLVCEALELEYRRDPYGVFLSARELAERDKRRSQWLAGASAIVGINTGCSGVIPYKKLSVGMHRQLIGQIKDMGLSVVLLGGPEDEIRNQQISHGLKVHQSPTNNGPRDGLVSVAACDIVVSGDSLGMHMAIALEKWVVAWFGPTCAHEIDLFDRGIRILSKAPCAPCWRRSCQKNPMCYDLVEPGEILAGVREGLHWLRQFSTRHSSGTCSSPSLSSSARARSADTSL